MSMRNVITMNKDIEIVAGPNTLLEVLYYNNNKLIHVQLIKMGKKIPIAALWAVIKHREFGIKAAAILG